MHLFYSNIISGKYHSLSPEESKHCIKVLRLGKGDTIHLTDGIGNLYTTHITDDSAKKTTVEIIGIQHEYERRSFNLHIAVAPTKNINRFEWFLEKATEIGIDVITPVICHHSERRSISFDRLNKIIISAMKQSQKAYLPLLNNTSNYEDFVSGKLNAEKYIATCIPGINDSIKDLYQKSKDAVILIGPEGDFSQEETAMAINKGFKPINLGKSRLRTETAAIFACASVNLMNL